MKKIIPYGHQSISKEDIKAVIKVLKSDYLTQGPTIPEFEEKLAEYVGARYAVVFNSGTAALNSAYFAAGLKKGDEFITTPNTFIATANAGVYLGAKPIFVDIEKETGNIDCSKIEPKISKQTKLIVPLHYGGHPVDLEKIKQLATKYKLHVVEDACHALGAKFKRNKIGSCKYSDMAVFSFHPVKHITTGEGGAVTTNNKKFYNKLLMFRTHGITKQNFQNESDGEWYYEMQFLGFNYRLTDFQAALGISQLKRINQFIKKRREIAQVYNQAFNNNPYFEVITEKVYAFSAYHLFSILLKDSYISKKRQIFSKLRENRLGVQTHYIPVYLQPYYQNLGYQRGLCPQAKDFYQREISIPIFPSMTKKQINYVVKTIFRTFKTINPL